MEGRDVIDEEFMQSDAYAAIVTGILQEAQNTVDEQRLEYLRKFIQNASRYQRPDVSWLDLFQRYIVGFSGAHVRLLELAHLKQSTIPASDRLGKVRLRNVPLSITDFELPNYSLDLRRICLADLASAGLVVDWRTLSGEGSSGEEFCLSRSGLLFMRFLLGEWELKG
jgi:hypothetical protein